MYCNQGMGGWVEDVSQLLKTGVETYRTATAPRFPTAVSIPDLPDAVYPMQTSQAGIVAAPASGGMMGGALPLLALGALFLFMRKR